MSDPGATPCPRCGTPGTGRFCGQCGASLTASSTCAACGSELPPDTRFCGRCGADSATVPKPVPRPAVVPWAVAGVLCIIAIAAVVYAAGLGKVPQAASMGNVGTPGAEGAAPTSGGGLPVGRAPDISNLTPREQFARLNDRVMTAAESGDTTTVINFWPMAQGAYQNLSAADRDTDARYHMATLQLMIGDIPSTLALADTIQAESANNLIGWYLRGIVAEVQGDSTRARAARSAFAEHYAAEIIKPRQEYIDHRPLLEQYKQRAGTP